MLDRVTPLQFPGPLEDPWEEIDEESWAQGMENELRRELAPTPPLYGLEAQAIATRCDNDDVLFLLPNQQMAVVHLTWRKREEAPPWPGHRHYPT
ncbi:MAG TPA: hypothetical protein DCE41_13855, partial [Cytophagales bacterium]|nr:hypothetical protein [Cytophagales bacterium]